MEPRHRSYVADTDKIQIAGFFTGGSLAIRGGYKAARNGAISCAILLAVIEGVGIGFQKMFAGTTKLEVGRQDSPSALGSADCLKAPQPPPSGEQMLA
jgi:import inner membrane translocase subunit TIM17